MSHSHLVLLGDSTFDNAAYVRPGPDVVAQLRPMLPAGWEATLLAVDGAVVSDVARQLARLPADATHLVLSSGGNDALGHAGILHQRASSAAEVIARLAEAGEAFARRYEAALDQVLARGLPTAVCSVYEGDFEDPLMARLTRTALMIFNDPIIRAAARRGVDLIDLREVCDDREDYANPIEPSVVGGEKIARAIVRWITGEGRHTRVLTG